MPHRSASPPQAGAAGDRPITPSSARADAPDRPSHRPRPAWARETALCAAPVAIAPPTERPRAAIDPAPLGRRQPANPHRPQSRARPRGFLPWRLSDAGPRCCSLHLDRPASETLHTAGPRCCSLHLDRPASEALHTTSRSKPPHDRSAVRPEADTMSQTVRSRFTPPERDSFKPAPLRASSNSLNYRASNIRTKMAVVRLRQRKGSERGRKWPKMGFGGRPRGSDKWPEKPTFCGFPTADQERKKNIPNGQTGGGKRARTKHSFRWGAMNDQVPLNRTITAYGMEAGARTSSRPGWGRLEQHPERRNRFGIHNVRLL